MYVTNSVLLRGAACVLATLVLENIFDTIFHPPRLALILGGSVLCFFLGSRINGRR
jgi:hypothetical protein